MLKAEAFRRPKAITVYEYKPIGVMNVAISCTHFARVICQYPFNRSNLRATFAVPTQSVQSSILGRGKELGLSDLAV